MKVSLGTTSSWAARPDCPSYALWLVCGLEKPAVLNIGAGTTLMNYPVEERGPGAALMWSPQLGAEFSPAQRCWISVVAYQHPARDRLTKASLNGLKALGFSAGLQPRWSSTTCYKKGPFTSGTLRRSAG